MTEAFERLPKWAQTEIRRLRNDLESAEHRLRCAFGEQPTAVEVEPYRVHTDDKSRLFLPDRTTIRFRIPGGEIDVHIRGNRVEIMSHRHHGDFTIFPSAANVIRCGFDDIEAEGLAVASANQQDAT